MRDGETASVIYQSGNDLLVAPGEECMPRVVVQASSRDFGRGEMGEENYNSILACNT